LKHARKAIVFMILLVTPLLLAGVLPPAIDNEVEAAISPITTKVSVPSYEDMTPILAYNDFDMDNYASDLEWAGDGSPGDPYIIEGYNITSNSDSILIHDTTRAFEIRNCLITSFTSGSGNGIMIDNATQVAIADTVVMDKSDTIDVRNVPSLNLENCTIYDGGSSAYFYNCTGATITECDIRNNYEHGINLIACNSSTVSNNDIQVTTVGAGINFELSHYVTIVNNHVFNCSAGGVMAFLSSNSTIEENIIHNNRFFTGGMCGIHLDSSPGIQIISNEIYENSRNGIYVISSDWVNIQNNVIHGNSDHGLYAEDSIIGTVEHNNISENGWWPVIVNELCGIYLGAGVRDWYISENTIWNNTPAGISLEFADEIQISNNVIYDNTHRAIYASSYGVNEDLKILENRIYGNGYVTPSGGIILYGYENCTVSRNWIYNNSGSGILSHGSRNNITDNEVYDTIGNGIYIEMTSYNLVLENLVYDNTEAGIFLYATNTDVIYNIVHDNEVGIHLYSSSSCNVYGNDIGWNNVNALQESSQTNNVWYATFDDFGNHWDDHVAPTGEGVNYYPITNITHTVAFDTKPDTSLNITTPSPISYEILETGNVLVWETYALNPLNYHVWIDGVYQYSEPWDGGDIELNVDDLPHGFYDILVSVFHISGHGLATDSNVTVEDLTAPSAIEGSSIITQGDGTPFAFQYSSEDPSGVDWAINNTVAFSISSTGLLTNATYLSIGEYVILITATDPYGHSTTLIVTLTVSAGSVVGLPTTLILAIGAIGVAAVIVIVIVGYKTKRR